MILSGTGTDGTQGCRAVKAHGGIALAQEPDSAKLSGMPQSAIESQCVDLVLPPLAMGPEIARLDCLEGCVSSPSRMPLLDAGP